MKRLDHPVSRHALSKITGASACALALLASCSCGCSTTPRLEANFDSDPLGSPSLQFPPPTPPNDQLTWTTQRPVNSVVATNPAGGRWVRITPLPAFLASPDDRQFVLLATTEPLTTTPPANIRGSLKLRLDGLGVVLVGLEPMQGTSTPGLIGGFELANFATPSPSGQFYAVRAFNHARIDNISPLPSAGLIAGYRAGDTLDISWSIDQASHTFSILAAGGATQSITFPVTSAGVATTPIRQLGLWMWLQKPSGNTAAFIDDLRIEEYK